MADAKKHYRVSVFCALSTVEAFVNYVGDAFAQSDVLELHEIAFLTDRQLQPVHDKFEILEIMEYHKIEDTFKFLFYKFVPGFDFHGTACWGRLLEFKRFKDSLTHPRQDEDETSLVEYKRITNRGLTAVIEIIDYLCNGIFKRPLRKQLMNLKVE